MDEDFGPFELGPMPFDRNSAVELGQFLLLLSDRLREHEALAATPNASTFSGTYAYMRIWAIYSTVLTGLKALTPGIEMTSPTVATVDFGDFPLPGSEPLGAEEEQVKAPINNKSKKTKVN